MMTMRAFKLAILLCALVTASVRAQTLAHKGWAGNGMTVEPWWQGAVFYQIDPVSFQDSKGDGFGDLEGIIQRLDYLQSLGVDAVLLSPFQLQPGFGRTSAGIPFDPKYGTEEDLDHLIQQASQHRIRILVDLPLSRTHSAQEMASVARFWLSRGIAGLRLTDEPSVANAAPELSSAQLAERLRELERLTAPFAGQRVLFWDMAEPMPIASRGQTRGGTAGEPQLLFSRQLAGLRSLVASEVIGALRAGGTGGTQTLVAATDNGSRARSLDRLGGRLGDGTHEVALARLLATALLAGRAAPLLYFGQEIGMATTPAPTTPDNAGEPTPMQWGGETGFTSGVPWIDLGRNNAIANVALEDADQDSLLNWYRRLSALRHSNAALRSGSIDVLAPANPGVVAWLRRAHSPGTPAVLVVCNLSDRPAAVSLTGELRRLGVEAGSSVLHTLATSSTAATALAGPGAAETGMASTSNLTLPAYGIYLGEAGRAAGLESAPAPVRRQPRHRRGRTA